MPTLNLSLPYIASSQSQKHVTHNEALDLVDALIPAVVVSATTTTAPASPAAGETYIVPTGGVFGTVVVGALAIWLGGVWFEVAGTFGQRVFVLDEGRTRINGGSAGWVPGQVVGAFGVGFGLRVIDLEADLSSGTQITLTAAIPARVIVVGVTSWVATNITGPDQFKVGVSGELDKFGGYIWRDAPSSNVGVVSPYATYSDTDILLTTQDDTTAFTGGTVRLAVLVLVPGAAPA